MKMDIFAHFFKKPVVHMVRFVFLSHTIFSLEFRMQQLKIELPHVMIFHHHINFNRSLQNDVFLSHFFCVDEFHFQEVLKIEVA